MAKMKLFMQVELDVEINENGIRYEVEQATKKVDIGDIETGLIDENGDVIVLESCFIEPTGLMGKFVNIINRREA